MIDRNVVKYAISETISERTASTVATGSVKLKGRRQRFNWRLSKLATPRAVTPKYEEPVYALDTGVRAEALLAGPNERDAQMAIPPLRWLYINKRTYAGHPNTNKNYVDIMDKYIENAWNSIYNEYKKARRDRRLRKLARQAKKKEQLKKGKRGRFKGKEKEKDRLGKKGKAEKKGAAKEKKDDSAASIRDEEADPDKQLQEWMNKISQPKKVHKPEPIDRGPIADLEAMKERIEIISTPSRPRDCYVPEPPPKHCVKESALKYEATQRIIEIAKPPPYRLKKEDTIVLGAVSPGALNYKPTERDAKLATPRARAGIDDTDLKEDPFSISKNALKYKATPRIIELAKPVERK